MELKETITTYENHLNKLQELWRSTLTQTPKKKHIKSLELEISSPNFWNDKKHSEEVISLLNSEKKVLTEVKTLLDETKDYLEMAKTLDQTDEESLTWLETENKTLTKKNRRHRNLNSLK